MPVFYPNHEKETYNCEKCGWKGLGAEAIIGDEYARVGFELDCPVCPGIEEVGFVEFPFLEDVAKNGTGIDKIMANQRLEFLEELEASYLKHPDQLPNIDRWQFTFVLQEKEIEGRKYLVVTSEGNEIWKELGSWEFYWRYMEIGDILLEKYGKYVTDIVPDTPWINIYGDSLSAADKVHDYRMKIREKYNKRITSKRNKERLKNPKKKWEIKHEKQLKFLNKKENIYKELLKENSILMKLEAEERRKNPKNFLDRWRNKLEQWKQPKQ